ncbi:MAG TPA: type II CAAX endopeptidase family protein [Pyrinomonadaceae bacterium]|nr:type II CAAX endopeptidase family protein [Pyrinomonadaceae bacterium]
MTPTEVFFDKNGTLRSGLRLAIFGAGFIIVTMILGVLAYAAMLFLAEPQAGSAVSFFVSGVVSLAAAIVVGWLCGKYLEHIPFKALGASFVNGWIRHWLFGLLFGAVTLTLTAGIGVLSGGLTFRFSGEPASSVGSTLLLSFIVFAAPAAFEEALFRGYALQTFVRSNLSGFGVLLTALIFATVHNKNPSANMISWLNTFVAGIWLGIAYLKVRDLWLPFGLHLAWNWSQGSIFGMEVSGLTEIVQSPLLRETETGPAWLTGGSYGIEGGIVTAIALAVSTVAIYFLPIKNDSEELTPSES